MAEIRWYKRDPTAALEGMANLTLEQRGVYNTILDLIYAKGGSVDDDPKFLCWWLRCDVRVWKRIRQDLLDANKLYLNGNTLRNRRADHEVGEARHRMNMAAKAGLASAAKRRAVASVTKEILSSGVEQAFEPTTSKSKSKSTFLSIDGPNFGRLTPRQVSDQPKKELSGSAKPPTAYTKQDLEVIFAQRKRRSV